MSDFTNSNVRRGDGVTFKGLLTAVLVLVVLAVALAIFGGNTSSEDTGTAETPAAAGTSSVTSEPAPINSN